MPRRSVDYRGNQLTEMDLPAVLRREPELCLIDELAHTNAPGVEHEKRYEDIEDVLSAGIDVFSTVNVQHLESLNDQVAELTGIRVRETVPDAIIGTADDVVLIDITPQSLIERLLAGKVYPDERVAGGAQQLLQDREPLGAARGGAAPGRRGGRGQADRSARRSNGRPRDERLIDTAAPQAIGERLLALDQAPPGVPARRAPRVALGAAARRRARPAVGRRSRARRRGAGAARRAAPPRRVLGAHLLVEHGDDVATVAQRVAARARHHIRADGHAQRHAARSRGCAATRCRRGCCALLPGLDLRIVADRSQLPESEPR